VIKDRTNSKYLTFTNDKLSLSTNSEKSKIEIHTVEEEIERLDKTDVLCIDKVLEKKSNLDEKGKYKSKLSIDKNDLISCPELNHNVDHVLNGTMFQINRDI